MQLINDILSTCEDLPLKTWEADGANKTSELTPSKLSKKHPTTWNECLNRLEAGELNKFVGGCDKRWKARWLLKKRLNSTRGKQPGGAQDVIQGSHKVKLESIFP